MNTENNYFYIAQFGKDDYSMSSELSVSTFVEYLTNEEAQTGATGTAKVLWDKQGLYIYVKVEDNTPDTTSDKVWENDSVEIYIDEENIKSYTPNSGCAQYIIGRDGTVAYGSMPGTKKEIDFNVEDFKDYYIVKAYIPFTKEITGYKKYIGFDVKINDRRDGKHCSVSTWSDRTGFSFSSTCYYGNLLLLNDKEFKNTDKFIVKSAERLLAPDSIFTGKDVLLPMKNLFETTGRMHLRFNEENKIYTALLDKTVLTLKEGDKFIKLDKKKFKGQDAIKVIDGEVFVPATLLEKAGLLTFEKDEKQKVGKVTINLDMLISKYSLRDKTFYFLGDSITYGACASDLKYNYPSTFHRLNPQIGELVNYAVQGWLVSSNMVPCVDTMGDEADAVILKGGINDFNTNLPLGNYGDTTCDTFYGALDTIMKKLSKKYLDKYLLVMTPLKTNPSYGHYHNGGSLDDFCNAIIKVAGKYAIPVLDLNKVSGINSEEFSMGYYTADGLHPTDKGYERIANLLSAEVKKHFWVD